MSIDPIAASEPVLKDRKGGLIAFGVLQILFGAFFALVLLLMAFGLAAAAAMGGREGAPAVDMRMMLPGILVYLLLAVWNVWMGIGSVLARRWARALVLVVSWMIFVGGTVGMAFLLSVMPDMYHRMAAAGQLPASTVSVVTAVTLAFGALFYTVLPGILILFYGSPHVKATCERRDPHTRWTDRCPLPVLAMSLMAASAASFTPFMGSYGWALPWFGTIVSGGVGATIALLFAVLLVVLTIGLYRLRPWAWWGAAGLIIVWTVSTAITFARVDMMAYYEKMEVPAGQLEMMRTLPMMQDSSWISWAALAWAAGGLGYLLWTRRHFSRPA